ncbi:AbrB/MazE/SpoVT family DNA-binding domain-containing protein [Candidatus Woesearchaeota archaeon]|nr:AbrB/MazE/SpoVT family DNA-binding domain-containing protein [Candidatus Woesearchaeota archaeon]
MKLYAHKIRGEVIQYRLTIPKKLVIAKNWKAGESISIEIDGNGDLILRKSKEE